MNKKILIASIFATLMLLVPMTSAVGISNVEKNNQISILNPPQPSPFESWVDFNITFYKPSSVRIRLMNYTDSGHSYPWFYIGIFSVIDFSNSPVGRIKYIKQSTGSEIAKTFTYFMVGIFQAELNLNSSHYDESTGLGYITGSANLFYFGL